MGANQASERDQTIMRVMKSLARLRAQGDVLSVRNDRGVAPVIVALPSDTVGEVETKVCEVGGSANVVLALTDGFMLWSWRSSDDDTDPGAPVHEHSTMDMLRLLLQQCDGETSVTLVRATVSEPRELAYQF